MLIRCALMAATAVFFCCGPVKAEDLMKKVLMIIAAEGFRDEELLKPKAVLEENGCSVIVASSTNGLARGMLGARIKPELRIDAARAGDYDAILFVGGSGAQEYWDDPEAHALARQAVSDGKVVGAICIAPVILARAGLLKGRKAAVWPSEENEITGAGAEYTSSSVVRDGRIITASGPEAAEEFGRAVVEMLKE